MTSRENGRNINANIYVEVQLSHSQKLKTYSSVRVELISTRLTKYRTIGSTEQQALQTGDDVR